MSTQQVYMTLNMILVYLLVLHLTALSLVQTILRREARWLITQTQSHVDATIIYASSLVISNSVERFYLSKSFSGTVSLTYKEQTATLCHFYKTTAHMFTATKTLYQYTSVMRQYLKRFLELGFNFDMQTSVAT